MKQQRNDYRDSNHFIDDIDDYIDDYDLDDKSYLSDLDAYPYDFDSVPIKGVSKKQARKYSSRKTRSRNRPRSFD
jgi:hypothetical protein